MSLKRNAVVGAVALLASDMLPQYLPAALNVGGLPVVKWVSAGAGAYAGEYFMHTKPTLMRAVLLGATAVIGADLLGYFAPSVTFPLGPIDLARVAGAVGATMLAAKIGVEKEA